MKGQVSIEFMTLLSLTLLASSILISDLNDRATQMQRTESYIDAEEVALKTDYALSQALARKNTTVKLDYSPKLEKKYKVDVNKNQIKVYDYEQLGSFRTRYGFSKNIQLNTTKSYIFKFNGSGINVK